MLRFFIITTMLISRSRVFRWHNTLRAYNFRGYFSAVNNSLKLKPDKSKCYYTALQVVNTSFFKLVGQASNKSDFGFRKSEERPLWPQAHTGTIFLDEISETSQSFQTTLLRVIQEMEVRPLGSNKVIPIDIRIIAATNRRLKKQVDLGNFRRDLYYRLNILRLNIPPLRYRKKDINHFVRHFIGQNSARLGKGLSISQEAMTTLKNSPWLDNIRELQNTIERLCVTCDLQIDEELVVDTLDEDACDNLQGTERIDCMRKNHIFEMLKQCGNNKKLAAEKLGISRTTLWRELKGNNQLSG